MDNKIYISKNFLVGHIEDDLLDMTDLPDFPIVHKDRLLGLVSRCQEDECYVFVNTNQYIINESKNPAQPAQLYLNKKQWKGETTLRNGMWVSFELKRQPKKERHSAINARELTLTEEDFLLCQNYTGKYLSMEGIVMGTKVKALMTSPLYNIFYMNSEGRQFILERLYQQKKTDTKEWDLLLSFMSENERRDFVVDPNFDALTPELRLILYKQCKNVEYINSVDIVAALSAKNEESNFSIEQLKGSFLSEADRTNWIEYVKSQTELTDELRSLLFTITEDISWLNSVVDIESFARSVGTSLSEVIRIVKNYIQNGDTELYKIISNMSLHSVVDALVQIGDNLAMTFLTRIPVCDFNKFMSEPRLVNSTVKDLMRWSVDGRARLVEDLYLRKSNSVSEWEGILSNLSGADKHFVFDSNKLKPTAELRICLFNYLNEIDWILHPSVISLLSQKEQIENIDVFIDTFKDNDDWEIWAEYVSESNLGNNDLRCELFFRHYHKLLYAAIQDKEQLITYFSNAEAESVGAFLEFLSKDLTNSDLIWAIRSLGLDCCIAGLLLLNEDNCIQLIDKIPDDLAIKIVTSSQFKGSNISRYYIGKKWETLKSEIKYVAFDLELRGDTIDQFAFYSEDNMRSYTGEDQLKTLFRALKKQPVIVGHNIKQWDLPNLREKGLELTEDKYIWDTLEIEILLNPCRYAYSLHTEHNAEADTRLTNDLFWNQLYRLSTEEGLVEQLRDVLPSNINTVLEALKIDYFADYFAETAGLDMQFFQELRPLSDATVGHLNAIAQTPKDEETLIIAPQNLWARIAQYIPVTFPANCEYNVAINREIVVSNPHDDIVKQTIIERFCSVSKTPLVRNLAQYLRVEGDNEQKITLSDDLLDEYKYEFRSHIECIDVEGFECPEVLCKQYKHIYTIGTELDDRVHRCKACENKTFADLLACGSKLPFIMASTNYAPVKNKEIEKVGIKMPDLAANVWIERERNGQFAFYRNYQYQEYRKAFLSHFNVRPKRIEWNFKGSDCNNINLSQVSRNKSADRVMRVNNSTTQRSKYWLFQFALISKIHSAYPQMPIVYIINEKDEIESITRYAEAYGYYVPKYGTGFRKLEYIGSHDHGMIIISKQEFINEIGEYRTDKAYCFIWDNMDIDRYMLMWDKLPFDDDLEEDADDERDDKVHHSTPRQCIHAAWPIYEHYSSLVMANNKETQCFLIDPYFDDYEDIATSCHARTFKVDLWDSNESYTEALNVAETYFDDSRSKEEEIDTETAMELIRQSLIGDFDWKPTQKEVLPYMWEKRGDCIVSMPTGEGKSVCFQGPALFRAPFGRKLSLVITPLRALMQDQVEGLQKKGFVTNVDYLSGDRERPEVENIYRKIRSGELALLFVTPERFRVKSFINVLYQRMEMDGGLEYVIFDEAHCISQWGQDFRPDYRNAVLKCKELRENYDLMFAMFSATVTSQVEADIRSFLPEIQRLGQSEEEYNPIRQHIGIEFNLVAHEDSARIAEIEAFIEKQKIDFAKSCMIIFCRTHRQCEETADLLSQLAQAAAPDSVLSKCVDKIGFYHAGLDADLRNDVYEQFKRTKGVEPLYILCATKAFGMGMDIPNVHYVVHFNPPSVLEDYLQEVGRAGRDEQMYNLAFNNGEKQIPAVCLASKDDFRELKDLLVKSQMSWSNLSDCKSQIVEYINNFQTLEQSKTKPIVVPFSVWRKNAEDLNDSTTSRLAFHWLEKIGHIKQQYLAQAHIDISVLRRNQNTSAYKYPVYRHIINNTEGERCLLSINDMRSKLRMSMPRIFNQLISLMDNGDIELNETIRCNLVPRRYCETKYMVKHDKNIFALHIIFEGLRNLLADCTIGKVRQIGQNERENIFKHLMDDVKYDVVHDNNTVYMPWKTEDSNPPKMAVMKYETFRKNIITRMGAQMFALLYYLPMVSYKLEKHEDEVICQIKVKDNSWTEYVQELENDCFKMIKYVSDQANAFNWANTIIEFGWHKEQVKKGFRYFENVLSVLHHLAYLEHSPLTENGIEILTTDKTDKVIDEGVDEQSELYLNRKDFDNQEKIKIIRLACINIFSLISKEQQAEFIKRYFQSRDYNDYLSLAGDYVPQDSEILKEVTDKALKIEEKKLEDNKEQKAIYDQPKNVNINVLAGPGAGKTHVLTLRCARLIYKEKVEPSHILVLAYNRAVVVELRNRLNTLFSKLGMSRIGHQLHVYTFHALAKKCMGKKLDGVNTELWECLFLKYLMQSGNDFIGFFKNIEYVLVDEFQDITNSRLESLICIHKLFPNAKYFTIGDINQSIYGFDRMPKDNLGRKMAVSPQQYAKLLQPQPYYERLKSVFEPKQMTMFKNYRSYQGILDKASAYITDGEVPKSVESLMKYEPDTPYIFEIDNTKERGRQWYNEISSIIDWAINENTIAATIEDKELQRHRHIDTIAIFFRTNNEVYRGYSRIKNCLPTGVRVRIQGESIGEFWRAREIFYLIETLLKHPEQKIVLRNDKTVRGIKEYLSKKMNESTNWDSFLLDIAYCLVLNYVDSIRSDYETHTWKDLADYIMDLANKDDAGQVYKIYESYRSERILQEQVLNIVLTTMHKVKGLEFDVVVTTPSFSGLPLRPHRENKQNVAPQDDDLADMEEERRLMYVAYTRAKKRLYIFKSAREFALDNNLIYPAPEISALKYTEVDPELKKYYLSYTAQQGVFAYSNSYIAECVKKDDPVVVSCDNYNNYFIMHKSTDFRNTSVGRLSSKSSILQRASTDNVHELCDFYVSSISVWTYEDTLRSDAANNTNFACLWSADAIKQGYIYVVQIAGFGTPSKQ